MIGIYSFIVLEARSSKSVSLSKNQGISITALLETLGDNHLALMAASIPWLVVTSLQSLSTTPSNICQIALFSVSQISPCLFL